MLTKRSVKEQMLKDLGSRDNDFMGAIDFVRSKLLEIAGYLPEIFEYVPELSLK